MALLLLVQSVQFAESVSPVETDEEGRLFTMELQQLVKQQQQQQLDKPQEDAAAPYINKDGMY